MCNGMNIPFATSHLSTTTEATPSGRPAMRESEQVIIIKLVNWTSVTIDITE